MRKRFIVSLASSSKAQNDAFLQAIKEKNVGYWHWLDNTWLITNSSGALSASELISMVKSTHPGIYCLVTEIHSSGTTWAGFGPKSEEKNMFKWLHENWND